MQISIVRDPRPLLLESVFEPLPVHGSEIEQGRVVWNVDGASQVALVPEHTKSAVRTGLVSPGELLRSDALDPREG